MPIETAIKFHLTGILGHDRVFPEMAPMQRTQQGVQIAVDPPFVIYRRIDSPRERDQSGPSGLARPRFQFDIVGDTYDEVKTCANQIRTNLDGIQNQDIGAPGAEVNVRVATLDNEQDDSEMPTDGTDRPRRRIVQDWLFWHLE